MLNGPLENYQYSKKGAKNKEKPLLRSVSNKMDVEYEFSRQFDFTSNLS